MARVTVEDCLKVIPNRFELVLLASQRAKQITNGSPILYKTNKKEKAHVVALREIGNNLLSPELINDSLKEQIRNKIVFKNYNSQNDIDDNKGYNSQEINVDELSASGSTDDAIEDIEEDDSDYNNIDLDNSIDLDDNEE